MSAAPGHESDVRHLYTQLLTAWNGRDAAGFAGLFADDGVSIGFDGSQMTGAAIREEVARIFRDHPTASYAAKVRGVRSLGPDAAVLRAIVGMVPPGGEQVNPDLNAVQSLVAERRNGGWSIVLFQNTPAQYHGRPEVAERHTAEIEEMRRAGTGIL
jgi:uncharacterized protein (TIGR02246 family)